MKSPMLHDSASIVGEAMRFAICAHAGQTRRGSDVPYVTHPIRVAALVMEYGGSADAIAAALLHDTFEDCETTTEASLEASFGPRITEVVLTLSDTLPGDRPDRKSPWPDRKRAYLAAIAAADAETRLIAACDKLDNLRSRLVDLESEGLEILARFSASPRQTRWYYEQVVGVLGNVPGAITAELHGHVQTLAGIIPEASFER